MVTFRALLRQFDRPASVGANRIEGVDAVASGLDV
jgi:hypothetical protein